MGRVHYTDTQREWAGALSYYNWFVYESWRFV
jgi:hypothetical protein